MNELIPFRNIETTPVELFNTIDSAIVHSVQTREAMGLILCAGLAMAKDHWDEFPLDSIGDWEYNFHTYARDRTGGYSSVHIDNMVSIGKTFLSGSLPECIPARVKLYDKNKRPTGEEVIPDPCTQNMSKLLVSVAASKDGRLEDPVAMGQLFNPKVSVRVLSATIQKTPATAKNKNGLRMWQEGIYILANENGGEAIVVAELNMGADPLVRKARERLLAGCNIKRF